MNWGLHDKHRTSSVSSCFVFCSGGIALNAMSEGAPSGFGARLILRHKPFSAEEIVASAVEIQVRHVIVW
jgi:hypothetical protein